MASTVLQDSTNVIKNYYDDVFDRIESSVKTHLDNDDKVTALAIENDKLKKELEDCKKELEDYKQELYDTKKDYKGLVNSLYKIFTSGIITDVSEDDIDLRDYQIMEIIEDMIKKHPRIFNKFFRTFGFGAEVKQGFVDNGVYIDN